MVYSESEELIQAYRLMQDGKFEEALQLMNKFEEKEGLSLLEKISCYTLKSAVFANMGKKEEFIKFATMAFQISQGQEPNLQLLDAYLEMAHASIFDWKRDIARDLIIKSGEIIKNLTQEPLTELDRRKSYLAYLKAILCAYKGEYERAVECAEHALTLREKLGLKVEVVNSLSHIKNLYYTKGDFDQALKYTERCLTRANEIEYLREIQLCHTSYGLIYSSKGEIDIGIEHQIKALAIAEKLNDFFLIGASLNNLGINYQQQRHFDLAQEHFDKSFKFFREVGTPGYTVLDSLFHLALDKGDLEGAKKYLDQIKQLNDNLGWKDIDLNYRIDMAVLLKTSPRALNRGKAEEILKQAVEEETVNYDMTIVALLNLCDLLLYEIQGTGMVEIVNELKSYLAKLINIAEKNHSYLILAETYLLQARLALLTLDLKETRLILTKAQNIAERYGLSRLAIKISSEHDAFLKQQNVWEKINKDDVSLAKRIELSGINQQMDGMLRKKEIEFPKVSDEDPVVLIIVSESGELIFSQSFTEKWSFEDDMFGSFLSAINSFSDEMFSEGLDRASFGQYSILMKPTPPFLVCYLFKGQSYLAQHRIRHFVESIQNDSLLWETFNKFYQSNQVIESKDVPSLDPLITEIFIKKIIPQMN